MCYIHAYIPYIVYILVRHTCRILAHLWAQFMAAARVRYPTIPAYPAICTAIHQLWPKPANCLCVSVCVCVWGSLCVFWGVLCAIKMTNFSHCQHFHTDHACASLTIAGCGGVREFYGLTDKCISARGHVRGTPIYVCACVLKLLHNTNTRTDTCNVPPKRGRWRSELRPLAAGSKCDLQAQSHPRSHPMRTSMCVCARSLGIWQKAMWQCGNVARIKCGWALAWLVRCWRSAQV